MSERASGRDKAPTLQFLGAAGTVTGSKYLLQTAHETWMVDCGLFQGLKDLRLRNWAPLPVPVDSIDGVILTHAHIDHSGYIPLLVKHHFRGRIYASEPTVDLCKILLPDCGYIQEEDARFAERHGFSKHSSPRPLYTAADAVKSLDYLHALHNGDLHTLGADLKVRLLKAGHLLGSRFIEMTLEYPRRRTILFGGDIGRYDALITNPPLRVPEADYLILEATYGGRVHPKEDIFARLAGIINETASHGGKVLIPAFAVGRTQEMLYIMKKLQHRGLIDPKIPVYLNTPLGIDATEIYSRYLEEHRTFSGITNGHGNGHGANPFHCENLHLVHDQEGSKLLNTIPGAAIIIAGSGMMTGGRILHHLRAYGSDPRSCLILVGYQAEGTRGRAIVDGTRSIKLHGQQIDLRCRTEIIESLSAHGDQIDIMRWLSGFRRPPKKTFMVHGEPEAAEALATAIREQLHWSVEIPTYLQSVTLE
ncbi:MAG: MBL fold metallo-hydrolase [Deltaproteobacteria bacterium]|nr:MBL fold metallo-hydrolase [Deltaproteobacteria bacterium]